MLPHGLQHSISLSSMAAAVPNSCLQTTLGMASSGGPLNSPRSIRASPTFNWWTVWLPFTSNFSVIGVSWWRSDTPKKPSTWNLKIYPPKFLHRDTKNNHVLKEIPFKKYRFHPFSISEKGISESHSSEDDVHLVVAPSASNTIEGIRSIQAKSKSFSEDR